MSRIDEDRLRELFEQIEAPPGLDSWRERIADVHVEDVLPEPPDLVAHEETNGATIIALPTGRDLRPKRHRKRSVAVAAAAAVVVGLGGLVVTTQLFSDQPPADPTMIIDGPDKSTNSTPPTSTNPDASPSGTQANSPTSPGQGLPNPGGNTQAGRPGDSGGPTGGERPGGTEPNWPPMVGDPTADNTGVPLSATLGDHYGDLRITTAGQVVTDLRVTGSVIVDAPNVTLRRVLIVAPGGAPAVRQNAAGLTIENSELAGGASLTQNAGGLVIRRSRLEAGITISSSAQVVDSFVGSADVLIPSGSRTVLLRHNTMNRVTMNDFDAPIRGVTVENSLLSQVDAPTTAGSASIYVLGNRFRGSAPSTGWNPPSATDSRWSDNTFVDSGAPANP
jgi:hypothetical protein